MHPDGARLRNALAYSLPELGWGFASAATFEGSMTAAFAKDFGASSAFVGAVPFCSCIALAVPMILTSWFVDRLPTKRRFVLWGHVIAGALYGVTAILVLVTASLGSPYVEAAYLAGTVVYFAGLGFLLPGWSALVGDLFPEGSRTRVLGFAFFLNRIGGIAGGVTAHAVLEAGMDDGDRWAILWGLAAAAAVLGSIPFAWIVESPRTPGPRLPFRAHLGSLRRAFRELPDLRRFIAVDALAVVGYAVLTLYGDVALRTHGMDKAWAGCWNAVSAAAQLASAALVAAFGGRVLPRVWLALGAGAVTLAAALTIVARDPWLFGVVAALTGLFVIGRQTSQPTQVLRLSRGRDGTAPIAIASALVLQVQGLAPLVAGGALGTAGYETVFAAVGISTLLACVLLATRVPDVGGNPVSEPRIP
jgi:MFS family permease